MKTYLIIISLTVFTNSILAQQNTQFSNDSDTSFWYEYKNSNVEKYKLGFIESDTADYSFRFWSFGLAIKVEFRRNQYSGKISRYVEANVTDKKEKTFIKDYPITSNQAFQIKQLIDKMQIEVIPSDKNIQGWRSGFDGIEYFVEYKRNNIYTFKNYWSPTAQDTLKEAAQFKLFVSGLDKILDLKNNSKSFQNSIPFDSWIMPGGGGTVFRIKQKAKKKNGG
ncbi:MAG: hypothetical protein IPG86_02970 [Chitinophagaceae bacterium]|nr:hypothetical protein [Chitinophagaceae bacterium]